jgi:ATP-dependent RNA helicase RhlB
VFLILVIDEADRLFDLGFTKDMRFLLRKLPFYEKRQSMLFSATLSYRVLELTYEYMNLPEFISVTPESLTVEGIEQQLFHVGSDKKLELLMGLLKREDWNRVLIFVNTKVGVDWLTMKLKGNGWPAEKITGDLPQRKRFRLMEQFKNSENYVHRIGRTARAGKTGKAFSLACEEYVYHLEPLEEMLGYKIPVVWPANDWFVADTSKPLVPERRTRLRRSGRRRSKLRVNKRTEAQPLSKESKPRRFPGAFFGFGPGPDQKSDSKSATDAAAPSPRKRPRRKKKSTFRSDGNSRSGTPDKQG